MKIKNKKLPIILGCLGVVAVSSIGFATWLVGHEQSEKTLGNINVIVDGIEDNGLILECIADSTDNKIKLAETAVVNEGSVTTGSEITETNKGDLEVKLTSFKLYVSDTYKNKDKLGDISFTVKLGEADLPTYTSTAYESGPNDIFGRKAGALSYLTFPSTITKLDYEKCIDTSANIEGWKVYDLSKDVKYKDEQGKPVLKFSYGDLFAGETSPATFYNKKINYDKNKPLTEQKKVMEQWSAAAKELKEMETTFAGKSISIKTSINIIK